MDALNWIFTDWVIVAVLIAAIVFIFMVGGQWRTPHHYDERQEAIRNRSFKYGFLATAIAEFIVLFVGDHLKWPVSASIMPLMIGCETSIIYDIFKRSYFPFNQKRRKPKAWIVLILGVLNTFLCLRGWTYNSLLDNLNSLVIWLGFILIGLAILYTDFQDKRDQE